MIERIALYIDSIGMVGSEQVKLVCQSRSLQSTGITQQGQKRE